MKLGLTVLLSLLHFIVCAQHKDNFAKSYGNDCKPCKDPWVGEIFYKVWGVCQSPYGEQDWMCNINQYNNGSWRDYNHLTSLIRGKLTGSRSSGNLYVFIKPQNVAYQGHIGWGFQLSDGTLYAGSTENEKGFSSESYWVDAGKDNDFWAERFISDADMFRKFKSLGYWMYKVINVERPKINAAKIRSEEVMMKGFQGISNNCLDHTYQILQAYGLGIHQMPLRQVTVTPNVWFASFYPTVNGNGIKGKPL